MRILAIAAHPDDIDFACAGTLALLAKKNDVYYLVATSGEKGLQNKTKKEAISIREKEQRDAAKVIGAKQVIFLRQPDSELEARKLEKELVKVIRKIMPDTIFSNDPSACKFDNFYRFHRDHREIALAAYDAIYPAAGNAKFYPKFGKPHHVKEMHFTGSESPNKWVDISKTIDTKVKALKCHKSQLMEGIGEFIKDRARKIGKQKNITYAEAFRVAEVPG